MHPNDDAPHIQFADDRNPSLISAKKVAEQLQMQLGELARVGRIEQEMVTADPGSAVIQRLLANIIRVFTSAAAVFMSDAAASAWMGKPVRAFRDKTAWNLIVEGRTEDVIRYLVSIEPGFLG